MIAATVEAYFTQLETSQATWFESALMFAQSEILSESEIGILGRQNQEIRRKYGDETRIFDRVMRYFFPPTILTGKRTRNPPPQPLPIMLLGGPRWSEDKRKLVPTFIPIVALDQIEVEFHGTKSYHHKRYEYLFREQDV